MNSLLEIEITRPDALDTKIFIDDKCYPIKDKVAIDIPFTEKNITTHHFALKVNGKQDLLLREYKQNPAIAFDSVVVKSLLLEGHNILYLVQKDATYSHYHNGNSEIKIIEPWTDVIGCDGTLEFSFTLPVFSYFIRNFSY